MSKKNLLIVAVLLIAVAAFIQVYSRRDSRQKDSPVSKPLASVNLIEGIDEIVIQKGKQAIHLQKNSSQWIISEKENYPADTAKLVELLDNITSYRVASLITRDESRLPHFHLQDQSPNGISLSLNSSGNTVFSMMVGKNRVPPSSGNGRPAHPDGTYIRIGESTSVFLIKENFSIKSDIDSWLDKLLIAIDRKSVKSINFESTHSRFAFSRNENKSDLTLSDLSDKESMDQQALTDLLKELESFNIDSAISKSSKLDRNLQLKSEISVSLFDGSSLIFQILTKTDKNPVAKKKDEEKELTYYAKLVEVNPAGDQTDWQQMAELGKNWLFKLDDWRAKNWVKSRTDFIKSPGK